MGLPVPVYNEFACDDVQLAQEITLLSAQIHVANYRLLKLIAAFDVRGGWRVGDTVRSCAHWLAAHCGMTIGAAREKVRVARRLASLPELEQSFAQGELSYSKVRAITRVATEANEGFLLKVAQQASASHLEKLVGKYQPVDELGLGDVLAPGFAKQVVGSCDGTAAAGAQEGVDTAAADATEAKAGQEIDEESRRENAREMYWFQDEDGMWVIHAKLPPEQGLLVMKALEAVARPIQEERQDEWKQQQKERMQAVARHIMRRHREAGVCAPGDAQVADAEAGDAQAGHVQTGEKDELGSGAGVEHKASQGEPTHGDSATGSTASLAYERAEEKISAETFSQFMSQVRADAFTSMAEHFLATADNHEQLRGLRGTERCQVVLHVDINTLREQRAGVCCPHGRAHFEDKPWLSVQTARRLSCDASLVTVLEDEQGRVLNVGRRSRTVPAHIRRALMERDGVCQYPGCHESRYVDAHHIQHWADGGETSLDNLVTLCRYHHRQLHRGRFELKTESVSAEILE